ncbi:MAG: nucleotidyl transferase AbiEii/AbiGii toxin family protein [Gordonia polyisoprenivorans]|nr:nucleotidyl transferase AbiEii/AbiGii toxin family protein [Gordonia polyisoprenivorans]
MTRCRAEDTQARRSTRDRGGDRQTPERALRRSHGHVSWSPRLTAVRDTDAAVLLTEDRRLAVRLQLLDHLGYPPWPTQLHPLVQRYADAAPATLLVPTAPAFAAWKTVAWHDRGVPRDLWDLWALAERGEITKRAAELFVAHGPIGNTPQPWLFTSAPAEGRKRVQLADRRRGRSAARGRRRVGTRKRRADLLTPFEMLS